LASLARRRRRAVVLSDRKLKRLRAPGWLPARGNVSHLLLRGSESTIRHGLLSSIRVARLVRRERRFVTRLIVAAISEGASPSTTIRWLLTRKVLAAYRHRTAAARKLDLSEAELATLTHLAEGAMAPGELGRRLQLTSGGMTALLHRLQQRGHIARHANPADRRSVFIRANPEALERIAELYAPLVADTDEATEQLAGRDREVLQGYLERIVLCSEQRAEELVIEKEAADAMPADDAMHLWA
jgi:DNA-binding MarR family transcriptional regulator